MAAFRGIPLSKISPAFLHSNSTSHTWPFSAIAELIDNAYDPDVAANEIWIDRALIHGKPCLVFEDDGHGMDNDHLLNMLSFGYCEKGMYDSKGYRPPIGHYGNGFKSGSMRLAKDALVFTVCRTSASVGFLSQTYLEAIDADCVFVPLIEYRLPHLERFKSQESRNNLEAILKYSPFTTEKDIKEELRTIYSRGGRTGTKIVLYNLKRHKNGALELDFESDGTDIRNPEAHEVDLTSVYHRTAQIETSEYIRSLRSYCGILFLRPRMKIYIRGAKVKSRLVSKSLSHTEIDIYRPTWLSKPLRITFGFTPNHSHSKNEDYGVMFYHRNRLIKAFEKLGYQKQANDLGVGVVGVVQVDFLKPIHNKQDFEKDEKYNAIMSAIAVKLNDYWNEKKNGQPSQQMSEEVSIPDWLWVQCENCLKWRRLPDTHRGMLLPDVWLCHMNPDPTHNRCDIPEEPEDEDEAVQRPTYEKTFKKKQEEKKRRRQAEIDAKERELQAKEAELLERQRRQQMNEVSSSQESRRNIASLQRELIAAKRREETQKRLILQIQQQKKQLEEQRTSLMAAAHSLQTTNTTSAELLEVADALTSESPVSSTSGRDTRGKRKSSSGGMMGGKKRISIKTETGEMLAITTNDDSEEEEEQEGPENPPSPSLLTGASDPRPVTPRQAVNRASGARMFATAASAGNSRPAATSTPKPTPKRPRQPRSQPQHTETDESVIDLTLDDDDGSSYSTAAAASGEKQDVKPNVDELNRQMAANSERNQASVNDAGDSGGGGGGGGDAAATATATATATASASNSVSSRNDTGEKGTPVQDDADEDKYKLIKHKYKLLQQRFMNLQRNVHRLLSFIVPDVDLGSEDDIEHIVMEMIRVNCACEEAQSAEAKDAQKPEDLKDQQTSHGSRDKEVSKSQDVDMVEAVSAASCEVRNMQKMQDDKDKDGNQTQGSEDGERHKAEEFGEGALPGSEESAGESAHTNPEGEQTEALRDEDPEGGDAGKCAVYQESHEIVESNVADTRQPVEGKESEFVSDTQQPVESEESEFVADIQQPVEGEESEFVADTQQPVEGEESEFVADTQQPVEAKEFEDSVTHKTEEMEEACVPGESALKETVEAHNLGEKEPRDAGDTAETRPSEELAEQNTCEHLDTESSVIEAHSDGQFQDAAQAQDEVGENNVQEPQVSEEMVLEFEATPKLEDADIETQDPEDSLNIEAISA